VSIFEANLNVLLNQSSGDTSWDKNNEKLYAFLTNLSATKSPSFPPVWATEPTSADEQGLVCKQCQYSFEDDDRKDICMHTLIYDMSSARDRWHPDCMSCHICHMPISILEQSHVANFLSFKCEKDSCSFGSEFTSIPHYYQVVRGMWLSWRVVV
jgi:hypothetical protein